LYLVLPKTLTMVKSTNKSTNTKSPFKTGNSSLFLGSLIVLLIASTPYLFYSYESLPDSQVWETSFFSFETSFPSWISFAWYFVGKAIPLFLLLLWFFTCKHWWHWIILVPIAMYAFQLWGVVNESNNLDSLELFYLIPLMLVLVPSVYLIRAKIFNKMRNDDLTSFEQELSQEKNTWQQIKDLFH
jgi:hypothetical protein